MFVILSRVKVFLPAILPTLILSASFSGDISLLVVSGGIRPPKFILSTPSVPFLSAKSVSLACKTPHNSVATTEETIIKLFLF